VSRIDRLSLVLLTACGSTPRPSGASQPVTATCEGAAAHYADVMQGGVRDTDRPATRDAYERITLARCRADQWPAPAIRCVATSEDPVECLSQLPEAHAETLDDEMAEWRGNNLDQWDLDMPVQMGRPVVNGPRNSDALSLWMLSTWFPAVKGCFEDKPSGDWTVSFSVEPDGTLDAILVAEDAMSSHGIYLCVVEKTRVMRIEGTAPTPTQLRAVVHVISSGGGAGGP
jgi:hypothetical protein